MKIRAKSSNNDTRLLKYASEEDLVEALKKFKNVTVSPKKKKVSFTYVYMPQKNCNLMADLKIGDGAWRLLFFLMSISDWENWTEFSNVAVATRMGVRPNEISRLCKILITNNILVKQVKGYNKFVYRINPFMCWKGSADNLESEIKEFWNPSKTTS